MNPGIVSATKAAEKVGASVIIPKLTDKEKQLGYTDFNDIEKSRGIDAVKNDLNQKKERGISLGI